jgi:carboxypeptidase C (cathepsin A)
MPSNLSRRILAAFAALLMVGWGTIALPQEAPRTRPQAAPSASTGTSENRGEAARPDAQRNEPARGERATQRRLPGDVTTDHVVELPDRTLRFQATAGTMPLFDAESGAEQAQIAYIAYIQKDAAIAYIQKDAAPASRPVTFVVNGGPGAASGYLQLGAVGPWRLPLDHVIPSSPPEVVPNAETWLDFTDLVFIDPVGTGYSRFLTSNDGVRRHFWSVDGDADALAVVMRKWIEKAGRQVSPKFILGESYGGFRAPKIARALQNSQGVGVNGLVLVSPVLDFGWRGQGRHSPFSFVARLPSMAATALEDKGQFAPDALQDVERYAAGDYLLDLLRGERDTAAIDRMTGRVAAFTGLDADVVRRVAARIDIGTFQRELGRRRGRVASVYDTTVTGLDPYPNTIRGRFEDPLFDGIIAPLSSAMTGLYRRVLNWHVEEPYHLLNREISSKWNWGRGRTPPEVVDDLRNILALDPRLQVLVVHGASDLVTPYFENKLIIRQLPAFGTPDRLKLAVYGGGHMFYTRDASRRSLREDAVKLYKAATATDNRNGTE